MERRQLVIAGLAAFVVLDLVLVVMALRYTAPLEVADVAAAPSVDVSAEPTSSSREVPADGSDGQAPDRPVVRPRALTSVLVASGADVAWVVDSADCGRVGTTWATSDGGGSWQRGEAPGAGTRIRPSDGTSAFVILGGEDCSLQLWSTGDAGRSWSGPGSAARGWARVPDDATAVHTPTDAVVTPCGDAEVIDLSADGGERATALCRNGRVLSTTDNGASWEQSARLQSALAVSGRGDGSGVVALAVTDCEGVVVRQYGDGAQDGGQCVGAASPVEGRTSVSVAGDSVWLLAGRDVWRSADGSDLRPVASSLDG